MESHCVEIALHLGHQWCRNFSQDMEAMDYRQVWPRNSDLGTGLAKWIKHPLKTRTTGPARPRNKKKEQTIWSGNPAQLCMHGETLIRSAPSYVIKLCFMSSSLALWLSSLLSWIFRSFQTFPYLSNALFFYALLSYLLCSIVVSLLFWWFSFVSLGQRKFNPKENCLKKK